MTRLLLMSVLAALSASLYAADRSLVLPASLLGQPEASPVTMIGPEGEFDFYKENKEKAGLEIVPDTKGVRKLTPTRMDPELFDKVSRHVGDHCSRVKDNPDGSYECCLSGTNPLHEGGASPILTGCVRMRDLEEQGPVRHAVLRWRVEAFTMSRITPDEKGQKMWAFEMTPGGTLNSVQTGTSPDGFQTVNDVQDLDPAEKKTGAVWKRTAQGLLSVMPTTKI